jgi:ribosomal protein S18 acetylase RimI-like enzyme
MINSVAMQKIEIRRAASHDTQLISELAAQTFWDAFSSHPELNDDDLGAYIHTEFCFEQIAHELADSNSIFLVAEVCTRPVGYAKVALDSRQPSIAANRPVYLSRLYTQQDVIGRGVGQALMDRCLQIAEVTRCDVMWLSVWEHSPRAQRFYERNGFSVVGNQTFWLGPTATNDLLMERRFG